MRYRYVIRGKDGKRMVSCLDKHTLRVHGDILTDHAAKGDYTVVDLETGTESELFDWLRQEG